MPQTEFQDWEYVARFWARVDIPKRGSQKCWEWQGKLHRDGYGIVYWHGVESRCHRVSYRLAFGDIPEDQLIRHLCHNPACVNPDHLAVGDKTDNAMDDWAAGKVRTGSNRWSSKYSDEQVAAIRDRSKTAKQVAEIVGCSVSYAYELRRHNATHRRSEPKKHQATAVKAVERR